MSHLFRDGLYKAGKIEQALKYIKASSNADPEMLQQVAADPLFEGIQSNAQFAKMRQDSGITNDGSERGTRVSIDVKIEK
jgi:hypothetical protein